MLEDELGENKIRELYLNYDSEKDPNGSIGRGIADLVYEFCNRNLDVVHDWIHKKETTSIREEEKYSRFYDATEKNHLSPFNVYSDSEIKAKIIKETIGYKKLRTGKGVSMPIEDCIPERIGEVFKRLYQKSLNIKSVRCDSH